MNRNLVIYEAVRSKDADRTIQEESTQIQWATTSPQVGDTVTMNSDRLWTVVRVESYSGAYSADIAYVALADRPVPELSEWTVTRQGKDNNICMYIKLTQERFLLWGWKYNGCVPTDLNVDYIPTGKGTQMRPQPSDWILDTVDSLKSEDGFYSAVHLCWSVAREATLTSV